MGKKSPGLKVPTKVKYLILLTAFSAVGYGYLTTVIAAYLPEMGISSDNVGLILGASGLAMILSAIPFGIMSDRMGRKWIFIAGLIGMPISMAICSIAHSADLFLIAAIIAGISEGAFLSTWNAM
ncbi:MAG TPA: MFS transporter, partial [Methanomassiliicoccales archaeon]|nr:MFS transporter [Methanomassiliicoccales archaeon]